MLDASTPALILAPMEGLTDAPMRAVQGDRGAFSFAVSEFMRVTTSVPGRRAIQRHVPELRSGGRTPSGLPVQIQFLGGDPELMARSAATACAAGARGVDINFGCPAPVVNRHDGGAVLLRHPDRIRRIVRAVRDAVPADIPVSAKLRLGWDSPCDISRNADMAAEGGASWLTIHGRTRAQGYAPPADWEPIGAVRERVGIPVVANGDIWTVDDFRKCRDTTGCIHFMIGRGALADPRLSHQIARELGLKTGPDSGMDWPGQLRLLADGMLADPERGERVVLARLKQWLAIGSRFGGLAGFEQLKRLTTIDELIVAVEGKR